MQNNNRTAIQLMGMIMSKDVLDVNHVLDLVEVLNNSSPSCRDIITIFEDVFKHEKSNKILVAVHALQYMVKNCSRTFHKAANRQSFQKRLLHLLDRLRGKTSILKQLNSNVENWCRIEAKVLYIVQLWYDAFILEESQYTHIINTYKILRKENVVFPPRSKNEKNLMYIETESPIFDNIEQIARDDQKKFSKKLNQMRMPELANKLQAKIQESNNKSTSQKFQEYHSPTKVNSNNSKISRQVNIDSISEKIAIIQSTTESDANTLATIEQIKKDIEFGKVKPNQQAYWKQIKIAAEQLVEEWEQKNSQLIHDQEKLYLERKLGKMSSKPSQSDSSQKVESANLEQNQTQSPQKKQPQTDVFDLLQDNIPSPEPEPQPQNQQKNTNNQPNQQVDLLDLL